MFTSLWRHINYLQTSPKTRPLFHFLLLNLAFAFIQLGYGIATGSLGLVSDAVHMFTDCAAVAVGLAAGIVADQEMKRGSRLGDWSYGNGLIETLSGFTNAIFLLFISLFIVFEASHRLINPPKMDTKKVLLVSVAGLAVNLFGMFALGGHAHVHHGGGSCSSHGHNHSHELVHDSKVEPPHKHDLEHETQAKHEDTLCAHDRQHLGDEHRHHYHQPQEEDSSHSHSEEKKSNVESDPFLSFKMPLKKDHQHQHLPVPGQDHDRQEAHLNRGHEHHHHHKHSESPSDCCPSPGSGNEVKHHHQHPHQHQHQHEHSHSHSHSHHNHSSHNMLAVYLHVLADTLGSVGVIVSTLLIDWTGWAGWDPLASLFIALLISVSVWPLVMETGRILCLDSGAESEEQLKAALSRLTGIEGLSSFSAVKLFPRTDSALVCTIHVQLLPQVTHGGLGYTYSGSKMVVSTVKDILSQNVRGLSRDDIWIQIEGGERYSS